MSAGQRYLASRLRSSVFGIATRRALRDYCVVVALIMFILLMVAWTIDLAENLSEVRAVAAEREVPLLTILLPYLGYRTMDMVTRLLPMACFFGGFLAEISRRLKLDSVILNAAGASPLRLMAGALWLAVILGVLQGGLEARWRPAAIWAQVDLGVGSYAHRFGHRWLSQRWIITNDTALKGEILRSPNPELRDVLVFSGIKEPRLQHIYRAERMVPADDPLKWHLTGVTSWSDEQTKGVPADDITLKIDMIPEMLTYLGVAEFNLHTQTLRAYDSLSENFARAPVDTAIWRRRTAWLLPGVFLVLGITLARRGFDGRRTIVPRLIGLAALGYILVVSVKVFWEIGESGKIFAPFASVAGMVLALAATALVVWRRP